MNTVAPQTVDQHRNKQATAKRRGRAKRPVPLLLKRGSALQAIAALLWLPQAGLIALSVNQLATDGFSNAIYYYAAGLFVLGLLRALIDSTGAAMAFDAARTELSRLRQKAIQALALRSPLDPSRPASGEAASMLAEQAEMVVPYLAKFVPVRLRVTVIPFFIFFAVLWFSWVAALILLIAAPLIPLFMALIGMRAQAASEQHLAELGSMNGFLLDRLRGLATIRSFDAVDATATRLRNNAENLRHKTMAVLRIAFLSSAVLELFSALGVAMVAVYTGFHLLGQLEFGAWGHRLALGEALFILLLAPAFFEPLRDLSAVWHDRAAGEAAITALEKLQQTDMKIAGATDSKSEGNSVSRPGSLPEIRLAALDFSYDSQRRILRDFNLAVQPGEHVALWAPSGGGKSTVLALIAGLVTPQTGSITIGGVQLDDDNAAVLRQRIGWIGQKPHIFTGSARQNITLGRNIELPQINSVLEALQLDAVNLIADNALVGEQGVGLSGGEALRLALARVAINAQADLILADEPTAHLDQATARLAADALLNFARGKTLIIATHDAALAARMDRVIDLADTSHSDYLRSAAE